MRPLRLLLDGFGTYRQPADADFSDVDFFALIGPTGSGKSTLIDGLCFALYGTVPRWGSQNAIAQALAPAANACRVCLVFEAAGRRYAAVRALTRDARGRVHTKEARLERLDATVPPDAPIEQILQASVEQLAEGPDEVKAGVQDLLGLTYEHFTQSVLLPQGRFSEFLHAKSSDRQDLLVELLAFGVYEQIGQRARERAKHAADRLQVRQRQRQQLSGATSRCERAGDGGPGRADQAGQAVDERLTALSALREQAGLAAQQARQIRDETTLLAALRTPAGVPGLAGEIAQADARVAEGKRRRDTAERREAQAQRDRGELPDRTLTGADRGRARANGGGWRSCGSGRSRPPISGRARKMPWPENCKRPNDPSSELKPPWPMPSRPMPRATWPRGCTSATTARSACGP